MLGVPVPGSSIEQQQQLDLGEERFNDGRVDHSGRLWVGTMDRQLSRPIGRLYRFDAGSPRAVDQGFVLSNGIGWSPDSSVMYFAETHSRRVYTFDYDLGSGSARNRGVFVQMTGPGGPDGLTVDAQGNVWVAVFGGGAIEQYRPDGTLARRLVLPFKHPTSCTFGAHDLQTLFITTSSMGLAGEPSAGPVPAGGVWAMRVDDAVGQREVPYAG
jgi:sugar lactone lactonase YvrE